MSVEVKICGLTRPDNISQATTLGAGFLGFVFFPPSKRFVEPALWSQLHQIVPDHVLKVGVFVDPDDEWLDRVMHAGALDIIQFHGDESVARIEDVKKRYPGVKMIKAFKTSSVEDLKKANLYEEVANYFLFDARPPKTANAIPGGNGITFDWRIMTGAKLQKPWFLSGGISPENIQEAIRATDASMIDLSSGVESAPGLKSEQKMADLFKRIRAMDQYPKAM